MSVRVRIMCRHRAEGSISAQNVSFSQWMLGVGLGTHLTGRDACNHHANSLQNLWLKAIVRKTVQSTSSIALQGSRQSSQGLGNAVLCNGEQQRQRGNMHSMANIGDSGAHVLRAAVGRETPVHETPRGCHMYSTSAE